MENNKIKVLIVDDNRNYREAFKRMLLMQDYEVCEAEDADQALDILKKESPDVMVTDLWMRTKDEGLELVRRVKEIDQAYPIVMISAVGTFETGAKASRLGAYYVISKSRIEEEMDTFLATINTAHQRYQKTRARLALIQKARSTEPGSPEIPNIKEQLKDILMNPDCEAFLKSEAYDALLPLSEPDLRETSVKTIDTIIPGSQRHEVEQRTDTILKEELSDLENFDKDSLEALRSAEILYQEHERNNLAIDFSRSIGFSYCFAVENEAKVRLRKKLVRLFSTPKTYELIGQMYDTRLNNLNLFFHQYILRMQQQFPFEFTIDNVKQTLTRIKQFEQCYKPDGLKALGIVILCFGRTFSYNGQKGAQEIANPLGLKGLDEDKVLDFARQLVLLQHYRNPYIHPEISEMEKLSKIRETAFVCLRYICRLT